MSKKAIYGHIIGNDYRKSGRCAAFTRPLNYLRFLGFLLLLMAGEASHAHPISGAEISYKCLDANGNYRLTLVIYATCSGIPVCSGTCDQFGNCKMAVSITGLSAGFVGVSYGNVLLSGVSMRDVYPPSPCPGVKGGCANLDCGTTDTAFSFIRYEFQGNVNMNIVPAGCCEFKFSFGSISSLEMMNSNSYGFYTETRINRCLMTYPNCNGTQFRTDAVLRTCANQGFVHNFGGFDPDGDSLVYTPTTLQGQSGENLGYKIPYSADVPFPYTPPLSGNYPYGFHFDGASATMAFKPSIANFKGTFAYITEKWRKINNVYQKVGQTQRQLLIQFVNCNTNAQPEFQTGTSGFTPLWDALAGKQICLDLNAKDADLTDSTYLEFDTLSFPPGLTATPNYNPSLRKFTGPREDSYKICWTPSLNQMRSMPYTIRFTTRDNKCPLAGRTSQQINIRVNEPVSIVSQVNCNKVTLTHGTPSIPVVSRAWRISLTPGVLDTNNMVTSAAGNVSVFIPKTGSFPVKLTINFGFYSLTVYDTFTIQHALKVDDDKIFCTTGTAFTLKQPVANPLFKKMYWYRMPDTDHPVDSGLQINATAITNSVYVVRAYDSSNTCYYSDSVEVKVGRIKPAMNVNAADQCLYGNNYVFISLSKDSNNNKLTSVWKYSTGEVYSGMDTSTRAFTIAGPRSIKLISSTAFGCKDSVSTPINVHPHPQSSFTMKDSIGCMGSVFSFTNTSQISTGTFTSKWNTGDQVITPGKDLNYQYKITGAFRVRLINESDHGCKDSTFHYVIVNYTPDRPVITGDSNAKFNTSYHYEVSDNSGSTYNWSVTGAASKTITKNKADINWGTSTSGRVIVCESASSGCSNCDTMNIVVSKTGIREYENRPVQWQVFPQPASDILMIKGKLQAISGITLYSADGRLIATCSSEEMARGIMALTGIENGIYFLLIEAGTSYQEIKRVVIAR